ncbi:MAG: hypothetical protein HYY01_06465 [Chloroflexi bacterium]|nr:hypothetical protein [Chloroflexota bacterium]
MGDYLYHYTSRYLAQEVVVSGKLRPGPGSKLYLSQDSYQQGATAAAKLAIVNKPVEVVFAIPNERVANHSAEAFVESIMGVDGADIRPGGGTQVWTADDIEMTAIAAWGLAWP